MRMTLHTAAQPRQCPRPDSLRCALLHDSDLECQLDPILRTYPVTDGSKVVPCPPVAYHSLRQEMGRVCNGRCSELRLEAHGRRRGKHTV